MPPYVIKCRSKGCDSMLTSHSYNTPDDFIRYAEGEGWTDHGSRGWDCPGCTPDSGDMVEVTIPVSGGHATVYAPRGITHHDWGVVIGALQAIRSTAGETAQ